MEIKILDSILHGELKPWLHVISDKKRLAHLIKAASTVPETYADLQMQLITLLSDFRTLKTTVYEKAPYPDSHIQDPFYHVDLPKSTDLYKLYYTILISKEALRLSNILIQVVQSLDNKMDQVFEVKQTLLSTRVLAALAAEELVERNYTTAPDVNSDPIHYIIFCLKETLIALYFEMQERFKYLLTSTENEDTFNVSYLPEGHEIAQLQPTASYYQFSVDQFINRVSFEINEAMTLLNSIPEEPANSTYRAILESFIFINTRKSENTIPFPVSFTDENTILQLAEAAKRKIIEEYEKFNYGHERLSVINTAIDQLEYASKIFNKYSIPGILLRWLNQQKVMFEQNANGVYSKTIDGKNKSDKAKAPLPVIIHATKDQSKSFAMEHLSFMGGNNLKNEKIMAAEDYKRMLEYTYYLIERNSLPTQIRSIPQTGFSTKGIRYTYYKIHEYVHGTQSINDNWIDFLHSVFKQFENSTKTTTKTKFSEKPKSYDKDLEALQVVK